MHQFAYSDILEDSAFEARRREREAFDRIIDLLTRANERGPGSRVAAEALYHLRQMWTIFIEDLGSDENSLPKPLRASLISIGIWIMKEAEELRMGNRDSFDTLVAINTIIRDGLK
ncbi:MAG: flagellar biosynthesis regulator FlaF [Beijerinckiaceae bacterium]